MPTDIRAYDLLLQATKKVNLGTRAGASAAISLLERALDIDPEYTAAHAWLGAALIVESNYGPSSARESAARRGEWHCRRAVEIDETDYICHVYLSDACVFILDDVQAILAADWGEKLPYLAAAYAMSGDLEKAKATAARAMRELGEEMAEPPDDWARWLIDNGWFGHGNHDGTLFEGYRLAGL